MPVSNRNGPGKRVLWELESSIRELAAAREEKGRIAGIKEELLKDDQNRHLWNSRAKRVKGRKATRRKLAAIKAQWQAVAAELAQNERPYGNLENGAAKLPPRPPFRVATEQVAARRKTSATISWRTTGKTGNPGCRRAGASRPGSSGGSPV